MRKLKRSECAVLTLVLKGKWFDMIARGAKREEYRDSKVWDKRIIKWLKKFNHQCEIRHLVVALQRGYRKPSMWIKVSWIGSDKYVNHPEWGEPKTHHYIIGLGERVELVDESEVGND